MATASPALSKQAAADAQTNCNCETRATTAASNADTLLLYTLFGDAKLILCILLGVLVLVLGAAVVALVWRRLRKWYTARSSTAASCTSGAGTGTGTGSGAPAPSSPRGGDSQVNFKALTQTVEVEVATDALVAVTSGGDAAAGPQNEYQPASALAGAPASTATSSTSASPGATEMEMKASAQPAPSEPAPKLERD